MAISLIGFESENVDDAATMSLDVPVGTQEGDLILFFGSCDGAGFNLPGDEEDFTLLQSEATPASHVDNLAFRIAGPSEPASYEVKTSGDVDERGIGIFATYRGQSGSVPINQSNVASGGQDNTAVMEAVTPSQNNSAVVLFVGTERGNDGNSIVDTGEDIPATMTIQLDNVGGPAGTGDGSASAVFLDVIQSVLAEVSGDLNLDDLSGTTYWNAMAVVINPLVAITNSLDSNTTREFKAKERLTNFTGRFVNLPK